MGSGFSHRGDTPTRMADQTIVPIGGGKFCDGLAEFLVALTGKERPRVLYIGTASAEDPEQALRTLRPVRGDRRGDAAGVLPLAARGPALDGARPGPDLRGRRQHGEHARDLAGARRRRAPARGAGRGRRAVRVERRRDLLVRVGRDGLVRPAARADGLPRLPVGQLLPALGRRGAAATALPRAPEERPRRPATRPTRASGCTSSNGELQGAVGCDEGTGAYRLEVVDGEVVETPIPTRIL